MGAELSHTDGQTDGHDIANSRISEFCESVYQTGNIKSPGI
jgi:hypothetical protein